MISSHHVHPHLKCQLCQILILRICTGNGFRSKVFPYFWPSISSSIRNSSLTEPDFDRFLLPLSVIRRPQVTCMENCSISTSWLRARNVDTVLTEIHFWYKPYRNWGKQPRETGQDTLGALRLCLWTFCFSFQRGPIAYKHLSSKIIMTIMCNGHKVGLEHIYTRGYCTRD